MGNGAVFSKLIADYPDAGVYVLSLRQHPRDKIKWLERAISASREIGDRRGEGADLGNLGLAYAALGDARKAIEFYEQRMVIAREIGDRRGEAFGSWNLGLEYEKAGELDKAIFAMQICVDFEREVAHPDAEKDAARIEEIRQKLQEGRGGETDA
jgi:tetratricopeptide (TPR) repeat protein